MNTINRKHIYFLVIFFTIAFCITNTHIELDHREKVNIEIQNNIEDVVEEEKFYPLEIKNYQNDTKKLEYSYRIKIDGISGAYKYRYKTKESYLVFTANGESTFTLESNESIIIYDLPERVQYEIEQITDVSKTYTTKINNEFKTKVIGNVTATAEVAFDNETIKEEVVPEQKEENPYTKDSYYFVIIIAFFAILIGVMGRSYKFRRFD